MQAGPWLSDPVTLMLAFGNLGALGVSSFGGTCSVTVAVFAATPASVEANKLTHELVGLKLQCKLTN